MRLAGRTIAAVAACSLLAACSAEVGVPADAEEVVGRDEAAVDAPFWATECGYPVSKAFVQKPYDLIPFQGPGANTATKTHRGAAASRRRA